MNFGYDFRKLSGTDQNEISSHLVTVGAEWRPTEKLTFAAKREQNLGEADPTYPNQTTLSASYQINSLTTPLLYAATGLCSDRSHQRCKQYGLCLNRRAQRDGLWS